MVFQAGDPGGDHVLWSLTLCHLGRRLTVEGRQLVVTLALAVAHRVQEQRVAVHGGSWSGAEAGHAARLQAT